MNKRTIIEGEIIQISEIRNEDLTIKCYQIIIDTIKKPKITLGECKIWQ